MEKAKYLPKKEEIKIEYLSEGDSKEILKYLYDFQSILVQVTEKEEPSILARYLIDLAKVYSNFYNENKIINENKELQDARIYLTYMVGKVLKIGAKLLGMDMPNKM